MARTGENIYQRANGRWEGKYLKGRVDGQIKYGYVTGGSYEEVYYKRKEAIREYEELRTIEVYGRDKLLLCNVANDWIMERKPLLKETTVCRYRNNLNLHILPMFGDRLITEITRDEVDGFVTGLCSCLSGNTAKSVVSTFKSVIEYGRDTRHVEVANLNGFGIKNQTKEIRVLSLNEQKLLEEYLDDNMLFGNDLLGIKLVLYTGIRLGELCALKWQDVLFSEGELFIHSTMTRIQTPENRSHRTEIVTTLPKSDCSTRRIQIPSHILGLLCEMRGSDGTYFLTRKRDVYEQPRTMENHFKRVLKEAGIKDANFHALRHTFATRCVELGIDPKTLSLILGHSSVKITLDRYVHPSKAAKQIQMDRLVELHKKIF